MTRKVALNDAQLEAILAVNQEQAERIVAAAVPGAMKDGFAYFAAFDGTNNDMENPGSPQNTNVAQLWGQYRNAFGDDARFGGGYFAGPGATGTPSRDSWWPPDVEQRIAATARTAYEDLCRQASAWLRDNPGRPVSVALAAFSRGCASAARFTQMLAGGIADPARPGAAVAPGKLVLSAGVLFDPVMTGVRPALEFQPNAGSIVDIVACDEYRELFLGANYYSHPGIVVERMRGNHCDIGGSYDNGLAAVALDAATRFLRASGLTLAAVHPSRVMDRAQLALHDENVDDYGNEQWSTYGSFEVDGSATLTPCKRRFAKVF
jgi:hypothetical protein